LSETIVSKSLKVKSRKKAQTSVTASRKHGDTVVLSWRFTVVLGVFVIAAVLIVWRIAALQVLPSQERGFEFLQRYGQSQFLRTEKIDAHRGVITDRNGEPLAVSSPVSSLWANPQILQQQQQHWQQLAKALNLSPKTLADKIGTYSNKEFMYLVRRMAPGDAQKVLNLSIPGVYAREEYQRFYPAGDVTAHLVGVTNIDDAGQEGLELAFDSWLQGTPGSKRIVKDLKGRAIEDVRLISAAQPGKDLALSIDLRLQYHAHATLQNAVLRHRAVSGSIVILDTVSGEVLAMVNQPTYNPNNREGFSAEDLRNRAMTDNFEPGSTMKPLTILAALESGRYHPATIIDTSPGYLKIKGKALPVQDYRNYGIIDLTTVLTKSSQVGISKIAQDLDPNNVRNMFFRLGIGETTGSGFPGETRGVLRDQKSKWHPTEVVSQAYGYGLAVNAVQLAQAYSVIANHGIKKPISLLKIDSKQQINEEQVVDKKIARQVLAMLEQVMADGGTGTRARLESYTAGGKTGTAHKVGDEGYIDEAKNSVFVGIAPIKQPRIAVAILINEARDGLSGGGEVAAPVFREVAESALRLLQVPPDKLNRHLTQSPGNRRPQT
jgi:cell division protein FtsI (penicillin-binding protein 3)